MSLQTRIADLVSAIGSDIKALQGRDQVIISPTEPVLTKPGSVVWVNSSDSPPTMWLVTAQ